MLVGFLLGRENLDCLNVVYVVKKQRNPIWFLMKKWRPVTAKTVIWQSRPAIKFCSKETRIESDTGFFMFRDYLDPGAFAVRRGFHRVPVWWGWCSGPGVPPQSFRAASTRNHPGKVFSVHCP